VIESFEARHAESRAEVAQLREQLGACQQQLQASQVRVKELVEAQGRQRRQAEQAAAAATDAEAALRAQAGKLQVGCMQTAEQARCTRVALCTPCC
jgi:DNA-binding protein H-NS